MTIFVERDATSLLCSSPYDAFRREQPARLQRGSPSTPLDHRAEAYSSKVTVDDDLSAQLSDRLRCLASGFRMKGVSRPRSDEHMGKMVFDELPELEDTDDDCTTVSSCSSGTSRSSRSSSSASSVGPSVSFSYPLVTDVRQRPRTRAKDVRKLFYSCEEIQRFRAKFRQERKSEQEDKFTISSESTEESKAPDDDDSCDNSKVTLPADFRIHRVDILHNDKLQTYVDEGLSERCPLPDPVQEKGDVKTADGDFFDNDSFWTGKITWY
jgi:hypothetical protein